MVDKADSGMIKLIERLRVGKKQHNKFWLWSFGAFLVFLISVQSWADQEAFSWPYEYFDDFSSPKAEQDSHIHSVFWPQGAFPPAEPYLFYSGEPEFSQSLGFADYLGQPAYLGYCFPINPSRAIRAVRGHLEIIVRFQPEACLWQSGRGYLIYSVSDDGIVWSVPRALQEGSNTIQLESLQGTCYIIFLGTGVFVKNLSIQLNPITANIRVPDDFGTIQEAIEAAVDGDVIEVAPGRYTGPGNRDIDFLGRAITVRSVSGPDATIIDCTGTAGDSAISHRGFYFHRAEKQNSVLSGFTVKGGRIGGSEIPPAHAQWRPSPAHPIGGGIYCEYSSPTIIDCVISSCDAEVGGGIGCVGSEAVVVNCIIEDCTAGGHGPAESGGYGGGIGLIKDCNAKIKNSIIRSNSGYYNSYGGGLYCRNSSVMLNSCTIALNRGRGNIYGGGAYCQGASAQVTLRNCIISQNTAYIGAGIYAQRGNNTADLPDTETQVPPYNVRIENCTIAHNRLSGPQTAALKAGGILSIGIDIFVKNSIVWFNEADAVVIIDSPRTNPVIFSDIQGGYPGPGNIAIEPLFASSDRFDYHLQSVYGRYEPVGSNWVRDREHSRCIDAGDPKDVVGQEPLPNGGRINMGAYGGTRQASKGGRLVYHVDGINGDDMSNGLSRASAVATIQKGIDLAKDGDVVLVWPAVYYEEVDFLGKAITLQSAAEAAVVTAIRGYAFSFFRGEVHDSVLRNFIVTDSEYGVFCNGASPCISNLTIVKNDFGIAAYGGANPKISNCILWDNQLGDLFQCEANYSCVQEQYYADVHSNISQVPLFVDANNGDFHLRSRYGRYWPEHNVWVIDPVTSPCIDAGDPNVYPAGERMPNGSRINMGAYGGTPFASMSDWSIKGDLNHDGIVNMKDFTLIAENWLYYSAWFGGNLPESEVMLPVDGQMIPLPD
jgi:hypothetical protein